MEIVQQLTVEFGIIKPYPETTIYYDGDDDTGIEITIRASGNASGLRINRRTGNEYIIINQDMVVADTIKIDTRKGKKSAILIRNGVETNILKKVETSKTWIHLEKGENVFTYTTTSGLSNLKIFVDYETRINGI